MCRSTCVSPRRLASARVPVVLLVLRRVDRVAVDLPAAAVVDRAVVVVLVAAVLAAEALAVVPALAKSTRSTWVRRFRTSSTTCPMQRPSARLLPVVYSANPHRWPALVPADQPRLF